MRGTPHRNTQYTTCMPVAGGELGGRASCWAPAVAGADDDAQLLLLPAASEAAAAAGRAGELRSSLLALSLDGRSGTASVRIGSSASLFDKAGL
jgi:hypothetical protein